MKQNILFVMNNLRCGGAEKALISLLETIDYSRFNVDLYLFKHEGLFMKKVPSQVNLLEEPSEFAYFDMPIGKAVFTCLKRGRMDIAIARIAAGFIFKSETNASRCEQRVWRYLSRTIEKLHKSYDAAVGYLEKNPIYFCVEKVSAKKKIGFIHNDYNQLAMDSHIDAHYFDELDRIVTVSPQCASILKEKFPTNRDKVEVMYNIVSPTMIHHMSVDQASIDFDGTTIVSVGRLQHQKGFDLAIEACKYLVEGGHKLKWYVIGEGEERGKLEQMVSERGLEEVFVLAGMQENPYPYIKCADIYVQPSRFEGKSIAIDEAKILHKPIVVTNFSTAKDQIIHGVNGIVAAMDPESIAKEISRLIHSQELRNQLSNQLSMEQLGTESEINKLYEMVC